MIKNNKQSELIAKNHQNWYAGLTGSGEKAYPSYEETNSTKFNSKQMSMRGNGCLELSLQQTFGHFDSNQPLQKSKKGGMKKSKSGLMKKGVVMP